MDLSSWNDFGRSVAAHNSIELEAVHEGQKDAPSFIRDARDPNLAEAVLQEIVRLNAKGRAREARGFFDPAHAPFIPELEKGVRGLSCCAILGPDQFLTLQGTAFSTRTTWHINGNQITEADPLAGFVWSRNRQYFLTLQTDGSLIVSKTYGSAPLDRIPALPSSAFIPTDLPKEFKPKFADPGDIATYTHLAISDDGTKILLSDHGRGVLLLAKTALGWTSQLLFPSLALGLEEDMKATSEDKRVFRPFFDMIHAALSPDGRFAAFSTQMDNHHIIRLGSDGSPSVYAELEGLSEYPHDACFSDDSTLVALNSCHFFRGATFACSLPAIQDLNGQRDKQQELQTVLNDYLRVYASGYLPASMTGEESGAFLLAGVGFVACITPGGKTLWELEFGSSAGGVDVCPDTGRVLIASHSGMLHLFDPSQKQDLPIFAGYKAPREDRRWLFWDRLSQPLLW
ncbi:hypothetical protein [Pelagibius sp. Alg239-R121]|uniref:hypothetical protein n=1 Tax=Pelagibius sp. Alg239-R121 TaxID=2993448 RepID=UPI0024A6BA20|nr:hypothetical protein [Pelagibius sp. Alg239-R121]